MFQGLKDEESCWREIISSNSVKVPAALARTLKMHPEVKTIVLHLDNDRIGRLATKAYRTPDDLFAGIGTGKVSAKQVANRIEEILEEG